MNKTPVIIVLLLGVVALLLSLFTVSETEYAIKYQLGRILRTDYEPGLHMKLPFVNNVRKFDRRILTLDMPPEQMNTSEQKYVDVDYFVKFRITDVTDFYVTTQGDEAVARFRSKSRVGSCPDRSTISWRGRFSAGHFLRYWRRGWP